MDFISENNHTILKGPLGMRHFQFCQFCKFNLCEAIQPTDLN